MAKEKRCQTGLIIKRFLIIPFRRFLFTSVRDNILLYRFLLILFKTHLYWISQNLRTKNTMRLLNRESEEWSWSITVTMSERIKKNIIIVVCFRSRKEERQLKTWLDLVDNFIVRTSQRTIRVLTHTTRFRAVASIRSEIASRVCSRVPRYTGRPLVQASPGTTAILVSDPTRPEALISTYIRPLIRDSAPNWLNIGLIMV